MQTFIAARYLAYPSRLAPLLLIFVFSVLAVVATYAGLLGIPLALLLFFGFFSYAFALLDAIVAGAAEPPVLTIEMMNPVGEYRPLMVLIVVVALFFASNSASYWVGTVGASLLGFAVLLILPAVLARHAVTGSLLQAFDVRRCVLLMLRLRGDYVLILLSAAVLYWLGYLVMMWSALPLILRIAAVLYAWLALFAVIGGVIFERREELGLSDADEPEVNELDPTGDIERQRNRLTDRLYAEWRGGAHRNAWQTVTVHLQQSADPLTELRWLYERIARWPDQGLANRLAQELLPLLLDRRLHGETLELLRERLQASTDFRSLKSADLLRLVRLGLEGGDRAAARALLKDFSRLYPDDPLQASATELQRQVESGRA